MVIYPIFSYVYPHDSPPPSLAFPGFQTQRFPSESWKETSTSTVLSSSVGFQESTTLGPKKETNGIRKRSPLFLVLQKIDEENTTYTRKI